MIAESASAVAVLAARPDASLRQRPPASSSLRYDADVPRAACSNAGRRRRQNRTCLVDGHSVDGGQGAPGNPVVVSAQEEISKTRAHQGWRNEYRDHRSGGAAARTGP